MNMKFFSYKHLPDHLKAVSKPFHNLAHEVRAGLSLITPADDEETLRPEVEMCLRKLLEAKDCAVRARMEMD